jgi:hypothetical protein
MSGKPDPKELQQRKAVMGMPVSKSPIYQQLTTTRNPSPPLEQRLN